VSVGLVLLICVTAVIFSIYLLSKTTLKAGKKLSWSVVLSIVWFMQTAIKVFVFFVFWFFVLRKHNYKDSVSD